MPAPCKSQSRQIFALKDGLSDADWKATENISLSNSSPSNRIAYPILEEPLLELDSPFISMRIVFRSMGILSSLSCRAIHLAMCYSRMLDLLWTTCPARIWFKQSSYLHFRCAAVHSNLWVTLTTIFGPRNFASKTKALSICSYSATIALCMSTPSPSLWWFPPPSFSSMVFGSKPCAVFEVGLYQLHLTFELQAPPSL